VNNNKIEGEIQSNKHERFVIMIYVYIFKAFNPHHAEAANERGKHA